MNLLGRRLRIRRRQLGYTQEQLAESTTGSFISRVERGHDLPSLLVLKELAGRLETTTGELLGDLLALEAAKLSILIPRLCFTYLEELPPTSITQYLALLTTSVQKGSTVPAPPLDAELHFLAALVHTERVDFRNAVRLIETGLEISTAKPLTERRLTLLRRLLTKESKVNDKTLLVSRKLLNQLQDIAASLPPPDLLAFEDVSAALILQHEALR